MTRRAERLLSLAAIGIAASLLVGIAGWRFPSSGERISSDAATRYFHDGKQARDAIHDSRCQTEKCHSVYPHNGGPESTFRNMHVEFVECPACHGREGQPMWKTGRGAGDRWIIRAGLPQKSGDPHPAFGPPVRCRGCHSEAGRKRIERGSARKLQGTFNEPVALRMLEEGSRKWVPDGM